MSRRIIIPRGLVNPDETTVIEIPEELAEERELIASPTCPTSCNDSSTGSSSGGPSFFMPQATSSPNRAQWESTYNVPQFSSIYDSSEMSYSMEPESIFGETFDVPPRNNYDSERSGSTDQSSSSCPGANRTYGVPPALGRTQTMPGNICPGGNRTYNPSGGGNVLGRTQTLPDRAGGLGSTYNITTSSTERTYSMPSGGGQLGRTRTMPDRAGNRDQTYFTCPAADRTHNIPQGGAAALGRTFNADRTYNIPRGGNRTTSQGCGAANRTRTISTSPAPKPPANMTMTIRHSTTSIQESGANRAGQFGAPRATSTPRQGNRTYNANRTYNVPADSWTPQRMVDSCIRRNDSNVRSFDPQHASFNPAANSTFRSSREFSRTNEFSSMYDPGSSSQYSSSGAGGSSCPGGCVSSDGGHSRGRHLNRRYSSTFSKHDSFSPRRNEDFSRTGSPCDTRSSSRGAAAGSAGRQTCATVGEKSLQRRHSDSIPQGVPSKITRTTIKSYMAPMSREENAAGSACPGRSGPSSKSQTKIIKKTSKTIIKSPAPQDSPSLHSEISSCYKDVGRPRKRQDRSCPDRTQGSGLGILGNAYLNSTRRNETPPPRLSCSSSTNSSLPSPSYTAGSEATPTSGRLIKKVSKTRTEITSTGNQGGRSAGSDIQAELQRMEEQERQQLQEELRSFQHSRRALMRNTSFTFGDKSGSGSGRKQCPGSSRSSFT